MAGQEGERSEYRHDLVLGLKEALQVDEVGEVRYSTLSRSVNKHILDVSYKTKTGKRWSGPKRRTVKWFVNEPRRSNLLKETAHDDSNRIEISCNSEARNLRHIAKLIGTSLIPQIDGAGHDSNLIVMEYLGGTVTRKHRFLHEAQKEHYLGETTESIPTSLWKIVHNAATLLGTFNASCNLHQDEFLALHKKYLTESEFRESRHLEMVEERLKRMSFRLSVYQGHLFDETLRRTRQLDLSDVIQDIHLSKTRLDEEASSGQKQVLSHGDYNLSQIIGNRIVDFESFGFYPPYKDLAGLLIISGLKNSGALLLSPDFPQIVLTYLLVYGRASEYLREEQEKNPQQDGATISRSISKNLSALFKMRTLAPEQMQKQAFAYLPGQSEGEKQESFSKVIAATYISALDELVRLGSAYDRRMELGVTSQDAATEPEYRQVLVGIQKGISALFDHLCSPDRFAGHPQQELVSQYFKGYQELLKSLHIIP